MKLRKTKPTCGSVPMIEAFEDEVPEKIFNVVLDQARGSYQQNLLRGYEAWSGASLAGKAREYSTSYSISRENLLGRINNALPFGWTASVPLVLCASSSRWERKLVLRFGFVNYLL